MATAFDVSKKQTGKAILTAAVGVAVLSELATASEGASVGGVVQQLVQVGGPTAIGAAAAFTLLPITSGEPSKQYLQVALISGGVATAVLIYAGVMPAQLDVQTLSFVALVGGSVAASNYLLLHGISI